MPQFELSYSYWLDANLKHSGILRDGGSAVLTATLGKEVLKIRLMRSLFDRQSENFNKIEVSFQGEKSIFSNANELDFIREFVNRNRALINPDILTLFEVAIA